jgi:tetratricopeptide (TPR) repeat protein/tRNA A-37 threonylcarbamoyl transferase component Bud32
VRSPAGSDAHADLVPGTWIDRYEVIELLGQGSMGRVYRARDSNLRREIALKHINHSRRNREGARERLRREALAMARVEHPAVVRLYSAEIFEGELFVAMELARGGTLAQWMRERPRSWRDIIRVSIEAGRGLAAAHGVGLIHRDIKPSNILLDGHGRPKISDFGLARTLDDGTAPDPVEAPATDALDVSLTATGAVIGTLAYMAPEQLVGKAVDARADQFAFCVVVWQALFATRPFAGSNPDELRTAVCAGAIMAPPARPRAPRRLVAALRRGLAVDPAARWPDMTSLVEELTRALGARQRWTVAAIVSAAAIASAAAAVAIMGTREAPDPCQASAAGLAEVWSTARREALGTKLAAIDPGQGAARFAKIAAAIDSGAERWSAMRIEACRATRVAARQSELLLDRRLACLDRWLDELTDTVIVAERAGDRSEVDQAVRASTALSPLDACADVHALSEALPLPIGARERAAAIELARRTKELEVEHRAGRISGLPSKVRELVASARVLDHAPTLAAALVLRARVDFAVDDDVDAESTLRELAQIAARAHDDRSAAFAWIQLLVTIGRDQGKVSDANALIPMATAAVLRAGDPPDLRADLLYSQAGLEEGSNRAGMLELLVRARTLLEQSGASSANSSLARRLILTMSEIAAVRAQLGDTDTAIVGYRDAIERWRALYGDDSPDEAFTWSDLGATLDGAGKHEDSIAAYRRALAIREARLGDSLMTAFSQEILAMALHTQGRWAEALDAHDRAIRTYRAQLPADDPQIARTLGNRAQTLVHLGRFDDAAQGYDEELALLERHPDETVRSKSTTLYNRGELRRKRGHCPEALRDYTRAAEVAESLHEAGAALLIHALVGQAACLLSSRHFDDAIARLNRALQLEATPDAAFQLALARSYLGRANVETRRDVGGGLAGARSARAALAAAADATNADSVRELDAWLAAHAH